MSFLSSVGSVAKTILTGGGTTGTLLRTVALGYLMNRMNKNALKDNDIGQGGSAGYDAGVRLQIDSGANKKVAVLYGSAHMGGIITEAKMTNNNQKMTFVVTLSEQTGNLFSNSAATSYTFNSVQYDDETITFKADGITVDYTTDRSGNVNSSFEDLITIRFYAGSSSSSDQVFPTGYSGTAENAYDIVPDWNSGFAMNNLVFAVIELNYSGERNIKGLGDFKFHITSSMNNPGDVIYDYLSNNIYGANVAVTDIDSNSITALNTYSITSVDYVEDSVTETLPNRYQINGVLNTEKNVLKNVEELTNSAGSWLSYNIGTGKWGVIINKEGNSVASFGDNNILSSISISGTGLTDFYNSVKAEFPNRDINDNVDMVTISIPAGDRNANEQDNALNLSYNFLNEPVQASLLSFIELKQSRVDLIIAFETDYSYVNLNAGDIIDVTNSKLGFSGKLFRIITVAEKQGEDALTTEITALEYDATVYEEDFTRFTRTYNNQLTTIGNIGIPGTPTINVEDNVARPRLEISSTAPTGTVEGMEFWLSTDVALADSQRIYRIIGTELPQNGNANVRGTFTANDTITFDFDTLNSGNVVVKTRGYNATTVGPFSANSAITQFTATQVTNAVNPNTEIQDETGTLLTLLAITTLLNHLDDLLAIFSGEKGVFDTIKDIFFPDNSGVDNAYDILANSSTFANTVQSQIDTSLYDLANDPAFISNVGNATVDIGNYGINALLDVDTGNLNPILNDVLAWDGNTWVPAQTCCANLTYRTPQPGDPGYTPPPTPQEYLVRTITLPNDIALTFGQEVTTPDVEDPAYVPSDEYDGELAPQTGSYYVYFTYPNVGAVYGGTGIYAELTIGSGDAKLYKSDGTLVETVSAGSMTILDRRLEIPFATRDYSTNYYVLMDEGIVEYCDAISPAITSPTTWNFNTPYYTANAYTAPFGNLSTITPPTLPSYDSLTIDNISWNGANVCTTANLVVTFSENVTPISGTITIKETDVSGNVVVTIPTSTGDVIGSGQIDYGQYDLYLDYDTQYYVDIAANVARTIRPDAEATACLVTETVSPTQDENPADNSTFTTVPEFLISSYELTNLDETGNVITDPTNSNVSIESLLTVYFTRSFTLANTAPLNVHIYEDSIGGPLHQTIDLSDAFDPDFVSEVFSITSTSITINPTVDFKVGQTYYFSIDDDILIDSCGVSYEASLDPTIVDWITIDFAPETSSTGADDGPLNSQTVEMDFGQEITPGTGNITIYNSSNVAVKTITATDPSVIYP